MSRKKKKQRVGKSISIKAGGDVDITADEVGRDKIINHNQSDEVVEQVDENKSLVSLSTVMAFLVSVWSVIKRYLSI